MTESMYRHVAFDRASINRAECTVALSFSSETPAVQRCRGMSEEMKRAAGLRDGELYVEILDHDSANVDLSMLNSRGAFLDEHDDRRQIGVVECAEIVNRTGRAVVKLDNTELGKARFSQMAENIRPHISAGYKYTRFLRSETLPDGRTAKRFAWRGLELSSVAVPADPNVGVGRSDSYSMNLDQLLSVAISASRKSENTHSDYSLQRHIFGGERTGPVLEVYEEWKPRQATYRSGDPVPWGFFRTTRDMTATGGIASGAAFIVPELQDPVPLLRNRLICAALGMNMSAGHHGNPEFPRISAGGSYNWLSEIGQAMASDLGLDVIACKPFRCTSIRKYSRLLGVHNPASEAWIRNDLLDGMAVAIERGVIAGTGFDGQPTGLLNCLGVQSAVYGGEASYAKLVAQERALATANVYGPGMGWALSPETASRWREIPKISGYPSYLLNDDNKALGYPAMASSVLSDSHKSILAKWPEITLIIFGPGPDIVIDPVTAAGEWKVIVTAHVWIDVLVRHPQAVLISADAANQ